MLGKAKDILESITERLKATANVDTIYGEPRTIGAKTIIPVAKVAYGFGAGGGQGPSRPEEGEAPPGAGEGGGGGGGVSVQPVGFIVAEGDQVTFVPIGESRKLLIAGLVGLVAGLLLGRKLARR